MVFRYHQAAASPPTSAEAAATRPTLAQLDCPVPPSSAWDEVSDSALVIMILHHYCGCRQGSLSVPIIVQSSITGAIKTKLKRGYEKFRFLYLHSSESMLCCIYSGG